MYRPSARGGRVVALGAVLSGLLGGACGGHGGTAAVPASSRATTSSAPSATATTAAPRPSGWRLTTIADAHELVAVSCPSASLCVAVDDGGNVAVSTEPQGGPSAWSLSRVDRAGAFSGVSCAAADLCVAVDNRGEAAVSTDPSKKAWRLVDIDAHNALSAISCPSTNLCAAVDQQGNIVVSRAPAAGTASWEARPADGARPAGFDAISCTAGSRGRREICVAGDSAGYLVTSGDPTGGAPDWLKAPVDTHGSNEISAVSCPSAQLCVAAGSGTAGNLLFTSTEPTAGAAAWRKTGGVDAGTALDAVYCESRHFCVAQDVATNMVVSTNPTGGAPAWAFSLLGTRDHFDGGISCPTARFCISVALDEIVTSTGSS